MKAVCDACGARYHIPDERVRGKAVKVRCKRCSHIFTVREARAATPATGDGTRATGAFRAVASQNAAAVRAAAETAGDGNDNIEWHFALNGQSFGPYSQDELLARMQSGDIGDEAYVWHAGFAEWKPATSVPIYKVAIAAAQAEQIGKRALRTIAMPSIVADTGEAAPAAATGDSGSLDAALSDMGDVDALFAGVEKPSAEQLEARAHAVADAAARDAAAKDAAAKSAAEQAKAALAEAAAAEAAAAEAAAAEAAAELAAAEEAMAAEKAAADAAAAEAAAEAAAAEAAAEELLAAEAAAAEAAAHDAAQKAAAAAEAAVAAAAEAEAAAAAAAQDAESAEAAAGEAAAVEAAAESLNAAVAGVSGSHAAAHLDTDPADLDFTEDDIAKALNDLVSGAHAAVPGDSLFAGVREADRKVASPGSSDAGDGLFSDFATEAATPDDVDDDAITPVDHDGGSDASMDLELNFADASDLGDPLHSEVEHVPMQAPSLEHDAGEMAASKSLVFQLEQGKKQSRKRIMLALLLLLIVGVVIIAAASGGGKKEAPTRVAEVEEYEPPPENNAVNERRISENTAAAGGRADGLVGEAHELAIAAAYRRTQELADAEIEVEVPDRNDRRGSSSRHRIHSVDDSSGSDVAADEREAILQQQNPGFARPTDLGAAQAGSASSGPGASHFAAGLRSFVSDSVRRCAQRHHAAEGRLGRSRVEVRLTVEPSGAVSRVRLPRDIRDTAFSACLNSHRGRWRFGSFSGDAATIVRTYIVE